MTCADCRWYNKIEGKYTGTCRYNPVSHYVDSAEMPCSKFDAKDELNLSLCFKCALEGTIECLKSYVLLKNFKKLVANCPSFKVM